MPSVDQAILLSGGLGTRLKDLFPGLPKALVPVSGRPIIEHQIRWLHELGVKRVHIAAGYKADDLSQWFARKDLSPIAISLSREHTPMGTAGAVRFAIEHVGVFPHYLVVNGDSLLPHLTLDNLCLPETLSRCRMTMAVTRIENASRYGTVRLGDENRASAFLEKNGLNEAGWVNGGVYFMSREAMLQIPADRPCSLERDIFPVIAEQGQLVCVPIPPPLLDMGTPEGHAAMTSFLEHR